MLQVSRRLTTFPLSPSVRAPHRSCNSNYVSFTRQKQPICQQLAVLQAYSSSSEGDEDGEAEEKKPADEQESDGDESLGLLAPVVKQYAVAPLSIPDRFPEVPVLPISRNPIFPRFVKMLEVCVCVCACVCVCVCVLSLIHI